VVEASLGRFLTKHERVHHRNRARHDNRLDNLALFESQSEHMKDHWKTEGRRNPETIERVRLVAADHNIPMSDLKMSPTTLRAICLENGIKWVPRGRPAIRLTEESVREALQGRTTLEAARYLRCHPQTLYSRYDHLLNKRASPNSLDPHKEDILRLLYKEKTPISDIAQQYSVSGVCVRKSVQRWRGQDARLGVPAPRRKNQRKSP